MSPPSTGRPATDCSSRRSSYAARRRLSPRRVPEDYVFRALGPDGQPADVRRSELFAPGKPSLVIYNFMFPRDPGDDRPGAKDGPCPSCVALIDQLDGMAEHAEQHVNFAVVAQAPLERVVAFADERGWRRVRLVSSAGTGFKRDYLSESPEGDQLPMLTVFHRDGGTIRHSWSSEIFFAPPEPGQETRHVGTLEPLWNLFDFTPEGRPDWDEQLSY